MHSKLFIPFVALILFILVVGLACGVGGSSSTSTEVPPPTSEPTKAEATEVPQPSPEVTATEAPQNGAVSNLEDAQKAVVQIEADGTFVNPDFTVSYNTAGFGSGFIIDPSGLAVTNNHVVTGAALLKVWIGGDKDKTYNGKVVGVSECSDLALIDIEGEDFPYLEWHESPIKVGMEVYAAGFPLGEPQYTLTKGIVSKAKAGGETSWASIDSVLEHDATINPGNSGGPLLDADGKVVGVNYRGRETNQYYAIAQDLAVDMVDKLKEGKSVDSVGVNGEAFAGDGFSGIWVYSVESGSPADKAGVKGGDIITLLEDLVLATDGTMADYCDVLRSHDPGDTLDLEVLRYASQEVMAGQLNGRKLEQTASFETSIDPGVVENVDSTGAYTGYQKVTDQYGAIEIEIPNEWTDTDGSYWVDDNGETIGAQISAAANLDNFNNTWEESGVFFGASDDLAKLGGYVNLLDAVRGQITDCKLNGRFDYEDNAYRGKYDLFENCGGTGNALIALTAVPRDNSQAFLILVEMQITKDADLEALDKILASFQVVGSLP